MTPRHLVDGGIAPKSSGALCSALDIEADDIYDLIIVGAGISGTADGFVASKFSNVRRVVVIEQYANVGQVNSHPLFNAQTSHDGSTETNYSLEKALKVLSAAIMLRNYLLSKANEVMLYRKTKRMVLAVTEEEVTRLKKRIEEFGIYYPDLRYIGPGELAEIEPKIMEGRDPKAPIGALVSSEGYAVNYQQAAGHFARDARQYNSSFRIDFSTKITRVYRRADGLYALDTPYKTYLGKTVIFTAGAYSLKFAHDLGYGKDLGILSVAGDFYSSGPFLENKVYRVQQEGLPFAEIHGDPDVLNKNDTRFGPTTKPLFMMERYKYSSIIDYLKLPIVSVRGFLVLAGILRQNGLLWYVVKNFFYSLPFIGKALFLREVRKIVPTVRYSDLKRRRYAGGVRPQIVNLSTGQLEMGDKTIVGDNIIFNTTPSPGASVCLANAKRDIIQIVEWLGEGYKFDYDGFKSDLEKPVPIED